MFPVRSVLVLPTQWVSPDTEYSLVSRELVGSLFVSEAGKSLYTLACFRHLGRTMSDLNTLSPAPMGERCDRDFRLDLTPLVFAIAYTVDLVGVDDLFHGRRVGMLAAELGRELGFDDDTLNFVYNAGLLHDCGVSSTRHHQRLLVDLEWPGAEEHCIRGYDLLKDFAPLADLAPIIRYHHSRWEDLVSRGLDEQTALISNLIYLADRIDVLCAPYHATNSVLNHCRDISTLIESYNGKLFSPRLMDAFRELGAREAFWLMLMPQYVEEYQSDMARNVSHREIGWDEMRQGAAIFARIIDAKSPFTTEHSFGVARLCRFLGEKFNLPEERCDMVYVAGLLHDIGKLQVPDEILENPGQLDADQYGIMKVHSYATYRVLKKIKGLEEIALWAASHHETLDGAGYPFHFHGGELPIETRIINVADIFQALAQNRPYRGPMDPAHIMNILRDRVAKGKSDARVVDMVEQHVQRCVELAAHD